MKKRIVLISLAVVLAASLAVGAIGCTGGGGGPTPSATIVIGMSRSLSGSLAIIHTSAFGAVYPTYISMLNAAGGITVGGVAYNVTTKVLNDNSDPVLLASNMGTLVADVASGAVHTIFGPDCTYFIDVSAPIANTGKCVMMTVEGGATFLIDPAAVYRPNLWDWPYVFVNLSFSDWYQLPILGPLLVNGGGYNDGDGDAADTCYVFWQADAHGNEYLASAEKYFLPAGLSIVGNASVLDPAAYSSLIATANATSPDVICCFCYPAEIIGLTLAAVGGGYNFDGWVVGPGGCFGWFGTTPPINTCAEDIITFAVANNKTSSTMQNLFNNVLAGGVVAGQDFWGHPLYWAAMQIWQAAVTAVGQHVVGPPTGFVIDQTALKNKIASYNSPGTGIPTVLGASTYYTMMGSGGGNMAYQCHTGEIGQWQSGYVEIIGGNNVTASIVYPKAAWSPPC